ncbi:MAG: hypothetical protein L3J35_02850 [Bacteroidales bacterium]|nr:hypothetical protein [Bacteroidales bacterium]
MILKQNSNLDNFFVGIISGLIAAFIITTIIVHANIKEPDLTVWDHYKGFFKNPFFKSRILLSLKGGAIGVLPLFYLFLNKKMMKAVKGLIAVVALIGILVVWGILT